MKHPSLRQLASPQEDDDDPRGTTGRDAIFDRDYSAPTGEDKFNKEILPKVMQVRGFEFGMCKKNLNRAFYGL